MSRTDAALDHLDANLDAAIARWTGWLRIPSVSAQPAHAADCRRAAEYARADLESLGFKAEIRATQGHPVVYATHDGPGTKGLPRLLYYGHYDVQPADPLELWTSPPFEPVMVDGPNGKRLVARGAVDDKGQVSMWLAAFRAWHETTGTMPCPITILIEGEEEVGSLNLAPFVTANKKDLAADIVVISDTGMWNIDTPALTTSLRGLLYTEVKLTAANRDLHSGVYGGEALNPINALTRALGALRDERGRILVPHFYDNIADIPARKANQWAALGFDEKSFLGDIGLGIPVGEADRTPLERLWARPTCDINGIWGGYMGPGSKTVIPSEAFAKISFRLVPGQNPAKIVENFKAFMQAHVPADAKLEFTIFGQGEGIEIATDSPFLAAAEKALAAEYGKPAYLIGSGGSIPVVETFKKELGLDSILMGFGLDDDQVHSPNEKFDLRCFHKGARSHIRLLGELAP